MTSTTPIHKETPMDDATKQAVEQAAQQAAQAAAQNAAAQVGAQVAQQIAEQVGQAVSQAIQKFMQTTGAATVGTLESGLGARSAMTSVGERVEDIGGGETIEANLAANSTTAQTNLSAHSQLMMANMKRTYDEYQHESLESIKRNRSYVDKVLSDAGQYDNQRQNIANQALQNAVETANMVGKQAVRHSDIAIDREWNVDEVATLTAKSGLQTDQIQAIVAAVMAEMAKQKPAA